MGKSIARAVLSPIGLIDKDLGRAVLQATAMIAPFVPGGQAIAAVAAIGLSTVYKKTPKVPEAVVSRLGLSFNPDSSRKIVFGQTAMGTDVLYVEPSGTNQEYIDYIIAVAAHKVTSIDEIYSDDKLMWSSSGGVQATYSGYLTVTTVLEGTSSNTVSINGGTTWGSSCRLTGCAYVHLRIKRTGNTTKAESPFAGGLPSRMTIIGKGMPVYDARYDSTRGGSGSMRADDQSTWAFTQSGNDIGKNPVCQLYTALLGWKIGGIVSVGAGMPPARLDFDDQITAANVCDEDVTFSGGTHNRYETHGMFDDDTPPASIIQTLCAHINAEPRDTSGKLGLRMSINDLSGTLLELTEDDVLGAVQWESASGVSDTTNVVRGRYTDATTASLYSLAPYSPRSYTSPDGIDRPLPLDFPMFQHAERAVCAAEQVLQRAKWQGRASADFGPRALAATAGQPVKLTFGPRGWTEKLFRIERQELRVVVTEEGAQAFCPMVLVEEDASIYTAPSTTAPASNVAVTSFDPTNNLLNLSIADVNLSIADVEAAIAAVETLANDAQATADGKIQTFYQDAEPASGMSTGDLWIDTNDGNKLYRYSGAAWLVAQDQQIDDALTAAAGAQATADGKVTTFYTESTPTAEGVGDLWYKASTRELRSWDGDSWEIVSTKVTVGSDIGVADGATRNAGDQLLPNANFDSADWRYTAGASRQIGSAVSSAWEGSHAAVLGAGLATEVYVDTAGPNSDKLIDVGGASRVFVRGVHTSTSSRQLTVRFVCYDSAGTGITTLTQLVDPSASVTHMTVIFDLPAGTAFGNLGYVLPAGAAGGGSWWIGNPRLTGAQTGADITTEQPVVQYLDETTGRATSRRLLNQFFAGGAQQVYSTNPLSATTDGGGVAEIAIAAHDVIDDAGTISMNSGTISGLSASTGYYVYEDNPSFAGGARTYVATTSRSALASSGRRYVGYITTPAAGGSASGGGGGRPGGDIP